MSILHLSACSSVSYLFQAGRGQMELFNKSRPIDEVLQDEMVSPRTRELLSHVSEIKKFGEQYGLKPTSNYQQYVDLKRPAVVWVVSACEELEFKAKAWSFPLVGSFPYLGWFELDRAKKYAEGLKSEGLDVDVRGAGAYSTLGWFNDPILSTMIPEGDRALGDLVDVVIHESVHASIYIKDQSYFNESLASFVAEGLTPIFLKQKKGNHSIEEKSYSQDRKESEIRQKKFHEAYLELDRLYRNPSLSIEQKRSIKSQILTQLRDSIGSKREINNATLIQYKTYRGANSAFQVALQKCESDWHRFLAALSRIKRDFFTSSQQEDLESAFRSWSCQ